MEEGWELVTGLRVMGWDGTRKTHCFEACLRKQVKKKGSGGGKQAEMLREQSKD